jgi:DNA-binding GntR family transcriptional regulator
MAEPRRLDFVRDQVSLRQRVVEALRDNIVYGTFEPGQKLVETDLAESMDISRTLLREALQQLQAEGLITNIVHKGPSVAVITEQDAKEIYQVRRLLEQTAGHDFTLYADDVMVERLAKAVDSFRDAAVRNDPHEVLDAKNEFYSVLFEGCGNRLIAQILVQLNNRVTMLRRMSLSDPGRLARTTAELYGIVAAVRGRDAAEVARLCAAHVDGAAAAVMKSFHPADDNAAAPNPPVSAHARKPRRSRAAATAAKRAN